MDHLLIIPPFVYSPCCFNLLTKNTICDDKLSCACFVLFVVPDCCKIICCTLAFASVYSPFMVIVRLARRFVCLLHILIFL